MARPPITAAGEKLRWLQLDAALDYLESLGGGGGGVADGDKGDVVVSGAGSVWTLDAGASALTGKQDTLVSATNIKTINGASILGSGDLAVSGGGFTGGTTTIDFGAAPGDSTASVAVTGQTGILSGSRVRAWIQGSTADFNAYEHSRLLPLLVGIGISDIVAGTGFTIHASTDGRLSGTIAIKWEWS